MTKFNENTGESKVIIGEATPVRIGFVILLFAGLVSSIWWAATITSKLDTLITYQTTTTASIGQLKSDYEDLKLRVSLDEAEIKSFKESRSSSSGK